MPAALATTMVKSSLDLLPTSALACFAKNCQLDHPAPTCQCLLGLLGAKVNPNCPHSAQLVLSPSVPQGLDLRVVAAHLNLFTPIDL